MKEWNRGFAGGVTAPITAAEFKLHIFDSDTWDTYFDTGRPLCAPSYKSRTLSRISHGMKPSFVLPAVSKLPSTR
ncbi:MAG: hypothetical protein SOY13_00940 [Pseudoflavonifractor sp.]|nr:hypothetical protein [Pseudoflavonifractor sp.]